MDTNPQPLRANPMLKPESLRAWEFRTALHNEISNIIHGDDDGRDAEDWRAIEASLMDKARAWAEDEAKAARRAEDGVLADVMKAVYAVGDKVVAAASAMQFNPPPKPAGVFLRTIAAESIPANADVVLSMKDGKAHEMRASEAAGPHRLGRMFETCEAGDVLTFGKGDGLVYRIPGAESPFPGDKLADEVIAEAGGKCSRCASPSPELHPAVQYGGEVQPCPDPFHVTGPAVTLQPGQGVEVTVSGGPTHWCDVGGCDLPAAGLKVLDGHPHAVCAEHLAEAPGEPAGIINPLFPATSILCCVDKCFGLATAFREVEHGRLYYCNQHAEDEGMSAVSADEADQGPGR